MIDPNKKKHRGGSDLTELLQNAAEGVQKAAQKAGRGMEYLRRTGSRLTDALSAPEYTDRPFSPAAPVPARAAMPPVLLDLHEEERQTRSLLLENRENLIRWKQAQLRAEETARMDEKIFGAYYRTGGIRFYLASLAEYAELLDPAQDSVRDMVVRVYNANLRYLLQMVEKLEAEEALFQQRLLEADGLFCISGTPAETAEEDLPEEQPAETAADLLHNVRLRQAKRQALEEQARRRGPEEEALNRALGFVPCNQRIDELVYASRQQLEEELPALQEQVRRNRAAVEQCIALAETAADQPRLQHGELLQQLKLLLTQDPQAEALSREEGWTPETYAAAAMELSQRLLRQLPEAPSGQETR